MSDGSFFNGSGFSDLLNTSMLDTQYIQAGQLNLPNQDKNSVLVTDSSNNVTDIPLTDGQLIIGSTGNIPIANTLTGTTNQVRVANAPGKITLSLPQDIDTSSVPNFEGLVLTAGAGTDNSLIQFSTLTGQGNVQYTQGTGLNLNDGTIAGGNEINIYKQINTKYNTLDDGITGKATFNGIFDLDLPANSLVITGLAQKLANAVISSTTGVTFVVSAGTVTINTPQDLRTSATNVVFAGLTDNGLSASELVASDASKKLQSVSITNSNSNGSNNTLSFSGSTLALASSNAQDISNTAAVQFANITDTGLTTLSPVKTDINKKLVSSAINLTSDTSGVLGIAGGGTNSSTALTNNMLMASAGGKIVEFTNRSSPSFAGTITCGELVNNGLSINSLVGTDGTKQLNSITLATTNTNGTNGSVGLSGSVLTANFGNTQNLDTSGQPVWSGLTDTSLIPNTLTASDINKKLQSVIISNSNGASTSFSGSTLSCSLAQSIATTASPIFAYVILTNECNFYGTTTTNIPNGSFTLLSYTTVTLVDLSAMYSSATSRFTIPRNGTYTVQAYSRISDHPVAAGGDTTGISIYKNGVDFVESFAYPDGGGRRCISIFAVMTLTGGDYLQFYHYQGSQATITGQTTTVNIRQIA